MVDRNDQPLGQASKRTCHTVDPKSNTVPLHRAFSLFMFNKDNELLMQQRSDTKITFPGLWSNTCCSHPLAIPTETGVADGIGVKNAAQRKVLQELGIQADQCSVDRMIYLTRIEYKANNSADSEWGEYEMDYILFLKSNDAALRVDPNPDEVKDIAYVKRSELADFLAEIKKTSNGATPWFNLMANSLLPKWWANLDNLGQFKNHKDITRF